MTQKLSPPLEPGDVYVYAHGNGALYLEYADGRSLQAPLAEVRSIIVGCDAAGGQVLVGGDDAPLAVDALVELGKLGIRLEPFGAALPPLTWHDGTTALMAAASVGADHLLDDLIARGVPIDTGDDSGSTALHHAALAGNIHAIDALVAAGAVVDRPNGHGDTPRVLAESRQHQAAVDRLGLLDAPVVDASGPRTFARVHLGTVLVWWIPPLLLVVLVAATWVPGVWIVLAVVATLALYGWMVPPPAFWAGGAPRRLKGAMLTLRRPTGSSREVDLAAVTGVVGIGGSLDHGRSMRPRWLLLAHPDGHPTSRRTLRRLRVPADELDLLAEQADRYLVVSLDGARSPEVLLPVVDLLTPRGVELSPAVRAEVAWARQVG